MKIVYLFRRPIQQVYFSVEKAFGTSRQFLPPDMEVVSAVSRFPSRGLWRRLYNIVEASFRQGDINHITGDVQFLALLLRKKKTLLTILDCVVETRPPGLRRSLLLWIWYIIPVRRVARVSAISQFTKDRLVHLTGCDPEKIRVVPVCITTTFRRMDRPFNASYPTVLHVGTTPNKNLDRLVEAVTGLPCRLQIVGVLSSEQRAMLDASGVDYGNVFGLSEEELIQQYAACDLLAYVSTYEGFGMPIVEANTIGRPVVTSNVASMPDVASDAACLVDPFNVGSIRAGLLKVIGDASYRETLVQNGFRNRLRFLPEEVARQYAEIYRSMVAGAARSRAPLASSAVDEPGLPVR